jgi:hypothetical protein
MRTPREPRSSSVGWLGPVVLVLVGLVWIGQGVGLLRGSSFMVDDVRWAVIGVALVAGGLGLGWRRRSRRAAAPPPPRLD